LSDFSLSPPKSNNFGTKLIAQPTATPKTVSQSMPSIGPRLLGVIEDDYSAYEGRYARPACTCEDLTRQHCNEYAKTDCNRTRRNERGKQSTPKCSDYGRDQPDETKTAAFGRRQVRDQHGRYECEYWIVE
jgi:hypothetical protein